MTWFESFNYCKLSNKTNSQELNVGNAWLGCLVLQTPWMVHRGMLPTSTDSFKFKNVGFENPNIEYILQRVVEK